MPPTIRHAIGTAAFVAAASAAHAQPAVRPPQAPPPQLPWVQTAAVNPVGIPVGVYSAEYEVALAPAGLTVAVGGTLTANRRLFPRDDRWASARVMYYPGEVSLRGLAVGASLGAHRSERRASESPAEVRASDAGATLGLIATYNRLVGRQERLLFGGGVGFRRVLRDVPESSPLQQAYLDGRVVLGFAF